MSAAAATVTYFLALKQAELYKSCHMLWLKAHLSVINVLSEGL